MTRRRGFMSFHDEFKGFKGFISRWILSRRDVNSRNKMNFVISLLSKWKAQFRFRIHETKSNKKKKKKTFHWVFFFFLCLESSVDYGWKSCHLHLSILITLQTGCLKNLSETVFIYFHAQLHFSTYLMKFFVFWAMYT